MAGIDALALVGLSTGTVPFMGPRTVGEHHFASDDAVGIQLFVVSSIINSC